MIRELTISEINDLSGGVEAATAIGSAGSAIASVACPVAIVTRNPYAAVACGVGLVASYAAYSYISGATAY